MRTVTASCPAQPLWPCRICFDGPCFSQHLNHSLTTCPIRLILGREWELCMWGDAGMAQDIIEETTDCAGPMPRRVAPLQPPLPGAVLFMEAGPSHCRWPLWVSEDEAKFICGSPRHSASTSYCCEHWIASGGARVGRSPCARYVSREPKIAARERLDLLTLRRREGF